MATGIDGTSVIIAGYTYGSWVEINEEDGDCMDFAGMSMDATGTPLWSYQVFTLLESETCYSRRRFSRPKSTRKGDEKGDNAKQQSISWVPTVGFEALVL